MYPRLRVGGFLSCLAIASVSFLSGAGAAAAQTLGVVPPPPAGCTSSTATFTQSTPTPIPDLATVTSTITVSGVDPYLWDLNIVTHLVHSDNGNLEITLRSPAGTVMDFSFQNGIDAADVFNGTLWDDSAGVSHPPGPASLATYTTGVVSTPLEPDGSFGVFYGENPNGVWTMTIKDILPTDTGTLNDWTMEVTTLPAAPGIAQASGSNPTTVPIPDDDTTVTSTIDLAPGFTSVCAVRAKTNLQHQANGDIVMTLTSPAGTVTTLTDHNGKFYANLFNGTVWDDKAPDPAQDHFYTSGLAVPALQPEETMSAFTGEDPTGTWTLSLRDAATGNTGTLFGWDLTVESCSCEAASATAPLRVDQHGGSGASGNNGVFEPGETVQVETTWTNPSVASFSLTGAATDFTGPAGPSYDVVDGTANFGTIASLGTANCFDATGDCYALQVTGSRPTQHWDATLEETVTPSTSAPATVKTWTLHIGGSFGDVPTSNIFYSFIENIFHNGVTGGCSQTDYCPTGTALRKQMAVFVLKAKEGPNYQPPPATGIFLDVPPDNPFAPWIEELYNRGVVAGCGAGPTYCPDNPVLRQQMAVFLLRTLEGSTYVPPSCTGVFSDVPCPGPFSNWIEDLAARGIAAGCGNGAFCPTNPNTRGQMAPFLVKTFSLVLYGP
jgi:subtilisin-like proprotein convertase family protein